MGFLVDAEGVAWRLYDQAEVADAVWDCGLIHIRRLDPSSIIVSLRPTLVNPITMTGAFYIIADLHPPRIFICTDPGNRDAEEFSDLAAAFRKIENLLSDTLIAVASTIGYTDRGSY